jgi:beta,beta-carotene 9',10'-dioxygenase
LTVGGGAGGEIASAIANDLSRGKPTGFALGFSSLKQEFRIDDVPVAGELPGWLEGVLLRNGPALFEIGGQSYNHWFDGLAMLHAFSFTNGRVAYRNRFLRSSAYEAWRREGVMKYSEFGTDPDPCRELYRDVSTLPVLGRVANANVSIEQLAHRFQAHTEVPIPVRFSGRTLETLKSSGEAPQGRLVTAHPHHDRHTGERFSYELELVPPSGLRILAERNGKRRELAFIPQSRPRYMHSFALTRRYVAVFTQPWEFDLQRFLSPDRGPIATNFIWDGSKPSEVILIDRRKGGVAASFELDPAFVFHHVNAFEDGDDVVLDVCSHRDDQAVQDLYLKKIRRGDRVSQARMRRLTLKPGSTKVQSRIISNGNFELPRIDYDRFSTRPYRYAYGVGTRHPGTGGFINELVKVDVVHSERSSWHEPDAFPGEPIFVAAPGARGEDDGVLLSVVLDGKRGSSFLLVLDARDLTEIARAGVPHHIPFASTACTRRRRPEPRRGPPPTIPRSPGTPPTSPPSTASRSTSTASSGSAASRSRARSRRSCSWLRAAGPSST